MYLLRGNEEAVKKISLLIETLRGEVTLEGR